MEHKRFGIMHKEGTFVFLVDSEKQVQKLSDAVFYGRALVDSPT